MTPRFATPNALNVFSGDSVSSGECGGAIGAGAYFEDLFLGEFMHSVQFTADPSRFETTSSSAMSHVSCSADPFKVFDAVIVTRGVDVIDFVPGRGWTKKRCSYKTVQEKQPGPTFTKVRTQISIASGGGFYEPTSFCALTSNIAPEFPISGDGVTSFVADNGKPVGVFHG